MSLAFLIPRLAQGLRLTTDLTRLCSYAVPQEVNKVGSESATFVHPVEERKDGIESLFKKQFDKGAKPAVASTSGGSSKGRSASPTKPRVDVKGKGKAKEEEEDDQEVQLLSDDDEDEVKGGGTTTRSRKDQLQKGKAVSKEETAAVKVLSDEDDEVVVLDTSEPEIIEKVRFLFSAQLASAQRILIFSPFSRAGREAKEALLGQENLVDLLHPFLVQEAQSLRHRAGQEAERGRQEEEEGQDYGVVREAVRRGGRRFDLSRFFVSVVVYVKLLPSYVPHASCVVFLLRVGSPEERR